MSPPLMLACLLIVSPPLVLVCLLAVPPPLFLAYLLVVLPLLLPSATRRCRKGCVPLRLLAMLRRACAPA